MRKSYEKLGECTQNTNTPTTIESPLVHNSLPLHPLSQGGKSKAYMSAMIALQNRIRQLECENKNLSEELKDTREELGKHKKMVEDITLMESNLRTELEEAHSRQYKFKEENKQLAESKKTLEDQVKLLMIEKNKHLEQNAAEKNQWRVEREQLINDLKENNNRVKELAECKKVMTNEVEELKASLDKIKSLYSKSYKEAEKELKRLKEENKKINEQLKTSTNKYHYELLPLKAKLNAVTGELDRVKARSKNTITHNKSNIAALKKTIDQQKKEIDVLKNCQCKYAQPPRSSIQNMSQTSVLKDMTLRERSQRNSARIFNSYKNSKNGEMEVSSPVVSSKVDPIYKKIHQKVLSQTSSAVLLKSTQMDENNSLFDINLKKHEEPKVDQALNEIFLLEREIADLSYQYKDLSTNPHNPISNSETLQKLSKELEEKRGRLGILREEQLVM